MEWVKNEKIPVKSWCRDIEASAWKQIIDLTLMPNVYKHIAIMPDAHCGYGMPIGGVVALKDAVSPNFVGVDIGCGMAAVKTDYTLPEDYPDAVKRIMGAVRKSIPLGRDHQPDPMKWGGFDEAPDVDVVQRQLSSARKQLGTLGGGNHFIEIQVDEDGHIWLMLHSGSRNFGYQIATEYNKIAQGLCAKWHTPIPNKDCAFLPIGSKPAQEYLSAMNYALKFALANRARMLERFKEAVNDEFGCGFGDVINIHHNYAAIENHFGKNVWVHRKGATSAKVGQMGIIPGSQGTASYIVEGLGNKESFMSCSHGAGRTMSRSKAKSTLNLAAEQKRLDDIGVIHGIRSTQDLDEAPSAYKDIDEVIEQELDLIRVVAKLKPVGVVKG